MNFDDFFVSLTVGIRPWDWQQALATQTECANRTIRIPTAFGKTHGVCATWLWHRVHRNDDAWPRRLVWCLPMRVLVEQTGDTIRAALRRRDLLWDESGEHAGKVGVHVLMGGSEPGAWHQYPEQYAVIVGTQDMLLSRALNRGYGAPRARWPMDFGLLNHDCLWIMDEVQLMDVGLTTSAQLQAFRDADADKGVRPCRTWWMSATLQPDWLAKSPDTQRLTNALAALSIPAAARTGAPWDNISKTCELVQVKQTKELAALISERHLAGGRGRQGPTLVVLNTVDRAVEVWEALSQDKALQGTDRPLLHSRFRPYERSAWKDAFLNRAACAPGTDRIIVATQVIEAGVDISAGVLITELAPWASLVQRFGRGARWGGTAQVIVIDLTLQGTKALPYCDTDLAAARSALELLKTEARDHRPDVAPLHLEQLEERHPELLPALYPFELSQLLLRHELDELFDTTPDLSGADIDISRFIRTGEERDLYCFWVDLPPGQHQAPDAVKPNDAALCAIPFTKARDWLCNGKTEAIRSGKRAWVWDYQDGAWRAAKRRDLYPGQTVLIAADSGGYQPTCGFTPNDTTAVRPVPDKAPPPDTQADGTQDDESLSAYQWKTIATHGRETGNLARAIADTLAPGLSDLLNLAGRWHDAGKVHPAFRGSIQGDPTGTHRGDLAKAPPAAWLPPRRLYPMPDGSRRPGFRHELASTLALFDILQRRNPDHPALLGPWRELLAHTDTHRAKHRITTGTPPPMTPLEEEILALDADRFDLLAYLICAHHGKLRMAWHAGQADQAASDPVLRIRGIRNGETLPPCPLITADGTCHERPATHLDLSPAAAGISPNTGAGWTDRVLGLLDRHGPFALAWLEALLRAADQRASRRADTPDPLLETPHGSRLEGDHGPLASTEPGGEATHRPESCPAQGSPEHGLRAGAGGREGAGERTHAPHQATRYVATTLGIVSYTALAPHVARRVAALEAAIIQDAFVHRALDEDLLRDLHAGICADLVPQFAGRWRRSDVRVSDHRPPRYAEVPMLMRNYCRDLRARFAALRSPSDDLIPEFLAFAEGRLLSIHPFTDFNGRTTRVLLAELLHRLDLPALDPTPDGGPETARYLAALKAADRSDWQPLIQTWLTRFAKEGQS